MSIDDIRNMIAAQLTARDWAAMRRSPNIEDRRDEGPFRLDAQTLLGYMREPPPPIPPQTPLSIDAGGTDLDRAFVENSLRPYLRRPPP